jgi:NIPSNAP
LITCFIRYTINPEKPEDFELYARVWMRLIEKYGGTHLGYFVPGEAPPLASFSFPGIGEPGPDNVAVALFTFPTVKSYENYRTEVTKDPECLAVTNHYEETKCFLKYERTFMRAVERG